MKRVLKYLFLIIFIFLTNCTSEISGEKNYSISEIKQLGKDGETINSNGILVERIEKRKFLITDSEESIIIDLAKFKKLSKVLEKNDKVIFSGEIIKKTFSPPVVKVTLFRKVEDFK